MLFVQAMDSSPAMAAGLPDNPDYLAAQRIYLVVTQKHPRTRRAVG
ncbi:hypothetical protein GCM10022247_05480 [Allokutzneria multivorans]|uniref:Uncharacterized protein n=1 Tax=Allokutzneria multivorans TaxID=1142134 RepID=A0ABP7QYL9_9PSEU